MGAENSIQGYHGSDEDGFDTLVLYNVEDVDKGYLSIDGNG